MKITLGFILSMLLSSFAMAGEGRDEVLKIVPKDLAETLGKDSTAIIKEFKNKISDQDKDALYLNYFGTKGDVTLGIKNQKISYVYLEVTPEISKKSPTLFKTALGWPTPEELEAQKKAASEETTHESGRFLQIEVPKESFKLEFKNNAEKSLHSIILWPVGEKAP